MFDFDIFSHPNFVPRTHVLRVRVFIIAASQPPVCCKPPKHNLHKRDCYYWCGNKSKLVCDCTYSPLQAICESNLPLGYNNGCSRCTVGGAVAWIMCTSGCCCFFFTSRELGE